MVGHSSLPTPRERSNSDSSGPPSLLWSPWLELGAAIVEYQSSKLSIKYELISKFSQLTSCNNQVTATFLSEQLPYYFSLFPQMNFLNSIPPKCFFSGKYMSSLNSIHWVILKDCLGIFWVSCHLMSHLLRSHFLGGS